MNIFQKKHFSAVKFDIGFEKKKMNFLWFQNFQKFEKSWKKLDWSP